MDEKERSQRRFSIGNQLMLAVLTLSLIFTVIISAVSLYRVFNEDLAHLHVELKQVESSYLSSFSASSGTSMVTKVWLKAPAPLTTIVATNVTSITSPMLIATIP
mgnify:CR=1 FL=1